MNTNQNRYQGFIASEEFQKIKNAYLNHLNNFTQGLDQIRPPLNDLCSKKFKENLSQLAQLKGREPFFNYLSSGMGRGPFIELEDGSVKLDLICGIGVHFFGHSHPELMAETLEIASSDTLQGNLQPGIESKEFLDLLLSLVGTKSRLKKAWPLCSGTMANETALKIIRQKKYPATRVFAFEDCFAGRSTAMQEITDNPKYREGQPTYGEVSYLPFYRKELSLEKNIQMVINHMKYEFNRHPEKYAGLTIELVQGEGGIRYAPKEWYKAIFSEAKKLGLYIWIDEVQTFGRTPELFAYQHFELDEWVDVVTIGKLSQVCLALYTEELNPKPGLVAGTFTGSAAAMKVGRKIIELLSRNHYYGPNGRIQNLSDYFVSKIHALKTGSCQGKIHEIRSVGGMIAFDILDGSLDQTKKFLMKLFDQGVVAFYAGHGPYAVRILPPFGVMNEEQIDLAIQKIEIVLKEF